MQRCGMHHTCTSCEGGGGTSERSTAELRRRLLDIFLPFKDLHFSTAEITAVIR
jgi:hypothetical protein